MKRAAALEEKLALLPRGPGVYLFLGRANRVLYVGKASDLRSRVRSYFAGEGPADRPRIRALLPEVRDVEVIPTSREQEALLLENSLIKRHRPRGNVRLKDDKNYLCVRIDRHHPFPRITLVRKFRRDGARYHGPYASARAVREAVRTIQAAFGLRVCSDHVLETRGRPCIYHEMGRCRAPCAGRVTRAEYRKLVRRAEEVLRGDARELLADLERRMKERAAALEYEKAAEVRDRMAAIRRITERQAVKLPDLRARDVIHVSRRGADLLFLVLFVRDGALLSRRHHVIRSDAELPEAAAAFLVQFYAEGKAVPPEILLSEEPEGRELLEDWLSGVRGGKVRIRVPRRGAPRELLHLAARNADEAAARREITRGEGTRFALEALAERLSLEGPPARIECIDVSTLQGTATVASLVAFEDGLPHPASYRRYRIRTVRGQDDFAAMREVLRRRVRRMDEMPLPDLLLVDGGRGQLSAALEAMRELGVVDVPAAGLAKARPGAGGRAGRERLHLPDREDPLVLEPGAPETLLVARIRDEAHRFAVRYHRKVRSQLAMGSVLDRVEGVGKAWRRKLLSRFGSVEGIREASLEDLLLVPGLPRSTARRIHAYLRGEGGPGAAKPEDRGADPAS